MTRRASIRYLSERLGPLSVRPRLTCAVLQIGVHIRRGTRLRASRVFIISPSPPVPPLVYTDETHACTYTPSDYLYIYIQAHKERTRSLARRARARLWSCLLMRALGRVYTYPVTHLAPVFCQWNSKAGRVLFLAKINVIGSLVFRMESPGRAALPAALFAPLNLKRSVLSDSSYSSLPRRRSLCLSPPPPLLPLVPSRITRLRESAFCPRSARRLARLRQENSRGREHSVRASRI